jgi:hypothetical protein
MTAFEDGLWERLMDDHDADLVSMTAPRARGARRPVVIGGGVTGLAAVTTAAVLGIGAATNAPPAYAMTQNADGSVTVTINDVADSIGGLNAKFAAMGIEETVVPVESNCPDTGGVEDELQLYPEASMGEALTFKPGAPASWKQYGLTGVIAAEQLPNGQVAMAMEAIKPPVPSCFPTTAYKFVQIGDDNGVPTVTSQAVTPSGS